MICAVTTDKFMVEIIHATLFDNNSKGAFLYIEAPETYLVTSLTFPFVVGLLPRHDGKRWMVNVNPVMGSSQVITVLDGTEQKGFISFIWTYKGIRPYKIVNIEMKVIEQSCSMPDN